MRNQLLALIGSAAIAAAAVSLTPERVQAQAAKPAAAQPPATKPATATPAAAKPVLKRTADGHPDLQGTYDVSTLTPVDRPRGVKNLVLTDQEAAAMEKYEAQRQVKNDAPLAGDRKAPPVGGETTAPKSYLEFLEQAGGGVVGGYNNFWLAGGDHVIRVDGQARSSLIIDPPDGQVPAMKPEAQRRNAAFLAGAAAPDASESGNAGPPGAFDGPETRPLAERCLLGFLNTSGPPTLPNYFYNNLKQIVQTKDTVVILVEMVHDARVIRMNAEHLPPTVRKWMGDSVGHWEGDTLVVETNNLRGAEDGPYDGWLDVNGSPYSEQAKFTHKIRRLNYGHLQMDITVDDPKAYTKPWTVTQPLVFQPDTELLEYICNENNHYFDLVHDVKR